MARAIDLWERFGGIAASAVLLALIPGSPAIAAEAGTRISNMATLQYQVGGADRTIDSNTIAITVAERLDLTLTRATSAPIPRGAGTPIAVLLVNTGNGREAFTVQADVVGGAAAAVAIDRDGDGRYDPAKDTLLTDGRTPQLAPGATLALVIVADTSMVAAGGSVTIGAVAVTASGAPGTTVASGGDGGGDAVVGPTGATASLQVAVDAAAIPTLVKTQTVLAPDGGSQPIRGAIVTYVLQADFMAATDDARIDDPVPAGTRYVAGSLRLDGTALADPADASAVHVALGPVSGAATHRIQFQVQIQ